MKMKLYRLSKTIHKTTLEGLQTQTKNNTLHKSEETIGENVYDFGKLEVILNQTLNAKGID